MKSVVVGWAFVAWVIAAKPPWLIGPGSLLARLLSGSQGFPGYEGIEAVLFVGTLPVLIYIARQQNA